MGRPSILALRAHFQEADHPQGTWHFLGVPLLTYTFIIYQDALTRPVPLVTLSTGAPRCMRDANRSV
jgi:hypothetical protein